MRSFRSYVKSSPNDAVPTLRSLPEVAAYVKDLGKECKVLSKYLSECDSNDEFFDVYRLMMEKQKILSNVRVTTLTKFDIESISDDRNLVLDSLTKMDEDLQATLSSNLVNMSASMGRVPTEISRLLHKALQSMQYEHASLITVPDGDNKVYTAQVSGLSLSDGGVYSDYFVCVSRMENKWHVSGSHSIPRFVSRVALDYKSFNTVKSGINIIKEILSSEGVLINERKFSLTPKESV